MVIITEIQVYKNIAIGLNSSGLTTPIFIHNIPEYLEDSIIVETQYQITSKPKLDYKITVTNNATVI